MKKKLTLNIILDFLICICLIGYTYSWMITEPSYGEVLSYERDLIVASSGVDVEVYIYEEDDYVLYEEENITVDNMAPGDSVRFKLVVKNEKNFEILTDIIFANIEGDLTELSPYLTVESSSPSMFIKNFEDDLLTTSTFGGIEVTNYMKFYDNFKVLPNTESTIYFVIKLDKSADNIVAEKELSIENILFLNS